MRMAGSLKNNEEGMADILAANESLLRVTDTYKRIFEPSEGSTSNGATAEQTSTTTSATVTTTTTASAEGAVANTASGDVANSSAGGGASGGDVLIDLAGLDFGPPPTPVTGATTTTTQDSNLSSLIDDIGLLGTYNFIDSPSCSQCVRSALFCVDLPSISSSQQLPSNTQAMPTSPPMFNLMGSGQYVCVCVCVCVKVCLTHDLI